MNCSFRYNKNYDTKVLTIHLCNLQINGGGVEDLPNGDCQKSTTKSLTQQNKSLSSSTATSTSNKGVTSSDSDLHSTNTNDKVSLQNGTNLSSDAKRFSDNSFVPSVLNYALTSTSSPSSQTSSIPESELVLDSSSGLLVKKSDEIRSSDSPTIEINGTNCNEVSTMTDPDSLGPCEPGTAVKLQGIVWQETDKGKSYNVACLDFSFIILSHRLSVRILVDIHCKFDIFYRPTCT